MKVRAARTPGTGAFLAMDAAKQAAIAAGQQLLDLSVGSSDLAPPPEALAAVHAALAEDPERGFNTYCLKSRTMPLLQAACAWFERTYGLRLDAATQALSLIGSQEGLAHLLLAVADQGDGVLMCDVAYPSYFGALTIAGLTPHYLPCDASTGWLPDFESPAAAAAAASCTCMLLNFPCNPTGVVADEAFWTRALAFCEQHDLLLISDAPYVCQVFDDALGVAPSPLALPGGVQRCVELHSFAKSYQLGGMRLGFILGNADVIASLESVKAPIDFNQWMPIQRAGIACLQLPPQRVREYAAVWRARAAALAPVLQAHGFRLAPPEACMYLWVQLPDGLAAMDDVAFCQQLVAATGVALSPGLGFGPGGVGWVRFALVAPEAELRRAGEVVGRFADELVRAAAA